MSSKGLLCGPSYRRRRIIDRLAHGMVFALVFVSLVPLIFILFYIVKQGCEAIDWNFLFSLPKPVGESGGGIVHAILGTIQLVLMACLLAVPLGVMMGIYLSENDKGVFVLLSKLSVDILQSTPSIVVGVTAYLWIVKPMGGFSALSGSVALALLMLPMVVYSTEETLKVVPYSLKEASLALGVPYYITIIRVVLPAGMSGIVTGILVGIARILGETAPLLFTAFGNTHVNLNPFKPVSAIPLVVFNYALSPFPEWWQQAWGGSLVLTVMVLGLNFAARMGTRKWKTTF